MEKKKLFTQVISKYLLGVMPVAAFLLLSMPLVLGSLYTFIIMLVYIPIIAMRIFIDPFAFAVRSFNIA